MISLSITESDRVPTAAVTSKVKQWNVAPGVVPSSLSYFRIRGGQGYIIGVPADTASKLLKEKDATKLRKMMAAMIVPEMQAARSGMPSPGKMILLMQSGDSISQVTQSSPGMGKKAGIGGFLAPALASATAGALGTAASNYAAGRDVREGVGKAALTGGVVGGTFHGLSQLGTRPAAGVSASPPATPTAQVKAPSVAPPPVASAPARAPSVAPRTYQENLERLREASEKVRARDAARAAPALARQAGIDKFKAEHARRLAALAPAPAQATTPVSGPARLRATLEQQRQPMGVVPSQPTIAQTVPAVEKMRAAGAQAQSARLQREELATRARAQQERVQTMQGIRQRRAGMPETVPVAAPTTAAPTVAASARTQQERVQAMEAIKQRRAGIGGAAPAAAPIAPTPVAPTPVAAAQSSAVPPRIKGKPTSARERRDAKRALRRGDAAKQASGFYRFSVFSKLAAELTTRVRNRLGEGDFALPGRRYPIHDRPHARNALARVAQHGTSSEQSQVQKAVHSRFPDIGEEKKAAARITAAPMYRAGQTITVHPSLLERVRGAISGGVNQYKDAVSGRATQRAADEARLAIGAHIAAELNQREMERAARHLLRRETPTPQQLSDLADLRRNADRTVRRLKEEKDRAVENVLYTAGSGYSTAAGSVLHPAVTGLQLLAGGVQRRKLKAGALKGSEIESADRLYGHGNTPAYLGNTTALLLGGLRGAALPIAPLGRTGTAALAALGDYGAHRFNARQWKKARSEAKEAGMPFLEQDRPEKVKEIYRALKREHPEMPAEMKARIAARQGKRGEQHQGPPYKGPIKDRER